MVTIKPIHQSDKIKVNDVLFSLSVMVTLAKIKISQAIAIKLYYNY